MAFKQKRCHFSFRCLQFQFQRFLPPPLVPKVDARFLIVATVKVCSRPSVVFVCSTTFISSSSASIQRACFVYVVARFDMLDIVSGCADQGLFRVSITSVNNFLASPQRSSVLNVAAECPLIDLHDLYLVHFCFFAPA